MIKTIVLNMSKAVLNAIYMPIKLFRVKDKIVFLSRQFDYPNLDFIMLSEEIKRQNPNIQIVFLCKKLRDGIINKITYIGFIFISMYHLATSKKAVIDTYIIPVSLLKHKKDLEIIQIWHALRGSQKIWTSNY